MNRPRTPLVLVTVVLFLDFVSLTLAMPLLPFWAERLGATPLILGGIITAYALAQLAFTPVLGALSDRHGRKPVIVISLLLSALSFALTALAGSLAVLLLARVIGGLGASIVGAAQAIVADRVPPRDQARAMGFLGAAIGLGHVVGPAFGGALSSFGLALPFAIAALLTLGNVALVWRFLPETHQPPAASAAPARKAWLAALRQASIRQLALVALAFALGTVVLETVLALFTSHTFGWLAKENGWIFAYLGSIVVVVQLGLVGFLAARIDERRLLAAGLGITAAGFLALPISTGLIPFLVALGLVGLGSGIVSPLLPTLFSRASPPEARGAILGLAQGVSGVGRLVGPVLAGGLFTVGVGLPFLACGLLCLLVGLWLLARFGAAAPAPLSHSTPS